MLKKNTTVIILSACIIAFVFSMTGYIIGAGRGREEKEKSTLMPPQENMVVTQKEEEKTPDIEEVIKTSYLLIENDGKVALVIKNSDGSSSIYKTYDISVASLPKADREMLRRGIETETISEALQAVEDYL